MAVCSSGGVLEIRLIAGASKEWPGLLCPVSSCLRVLYTYVLACERAQTHIETQRQKLSDARMHA